MKQENVNKFKDILMKSFIINKYLEYYLNDDINQIIEDYELDYYKEELPKVIGYTINNENKIIVSIYFVDECSDNGIGLETKEINIDDFLDWLKDN